MREILASEPKPDHIRPIDDVERDTGEHHKVILRHDLAREVAVVAEEEEALRQEMEAQILGYLAGNRPVEKYSDDCPTPVCVPRFSLDDDETTPARSPRGRKFLKPDND